MFRHKQQKEAPPKAMTGDDVERLINEQAAAAGAITDDQEVGDAFALAQGTGVRARATITSAAMGSTSEWGTVWRMQMHVQVSATDAFDATLAMMYQGVEASDGAPWGVGDVAPVVFDPDDRTKVRFLPPGLQEAVRWRVPAVCPRCGAPVDQSTQSLVDHPACQYCGEPLPADPLA